jgi:hypothetical protein
MHIYYGLDKLKPIRSINLSESDQAGSQWAYVVYLL